MTQRVLKNQSNTLILTLTEKITLTDPNFLIEIFSKQNHDSTIARLSGDSTTNITRFNDFTLTESPTEDLETGVVNLIPGEYNYFIWQTSASTLFLSAATSIVESGPLVVVGTGQTTSTFSTTPDEFTVQY